MKEGMKASRQTLTRVRRTPRTGDGLITQHGKPAGLPTSDKPRRTEGSRAEKRSLGPGIGSCIISHNLDVLPRTISPAAPVAASSDTEVPPEQ